MAKKKKVSKPRNRLISWMFPPKFGEKPPNLKPRSTSKGKRKTKGKGVKPKKTGT